MSLEKLSTNEVIEKTSLDTNECYHKNPDGTCSGLTNEIAEKMNLTLKELDKKYHCDGSEACVLSKAGHHVDKRRAQIELMTKFKPEGPKNSTALLNNVVIDNCLISWCADYPDFYPCPFAMMDFARTKEKFETINLVDLFTKKHVDGKYKRIFGCVINTDNSTGPGKHWVSCVVNARDMKNILILYYNSAGNPPPEPIIEWMERRRRELSEMDACEGDVEIIPVTRVRHQESNTECGVYSLYFIRCMIEGNSYDMFFNNIIDDEAMKKFRKFLFR